MCCCCCYRPGLIHTCETVRVTFKTNAACLSCIFTHFAEAEKTNCERALNVHNTYCIKVLPPAGFGERVTPPVVKQTCIHLTLPTINISVDEDISKYYLSFRATKNMSFPYLPYNNSYKTRNETTGLTRLLSLVRTDQAVIIPR